MNTIGVNQKLKTIFKIEKGTLQSTKNKPGSYVFVTAAEDWKTHKDYTHNCEALIFAAGASGSLGRIHYIKGEFIASDLCYILTPKGINEKKVSLRYYFHFFEYRREKIVRLLARGSAKKAINKTDFSNLEVPYPKYTDQVKYAKQLDRVAKSKNTINEKMKSINKQLNLILLLKMNEVFVGE